jgi:Integrase core domain/Mu transposase, C-terminal domain
MITAASASPQASYAAPHPRRCARCSSARFGPTGCPMRCSPTTGRSSPAATAPTPPRSCSTGSFVSTGWRTATRHLAQPTTTGKIERFHRNLRREFLDGKVFDSLEQAQGELDAWVGDYNEVRPHQSLEMATPAERFRLRPSTERPSIPVEAGEDHPGQWVLRRVASNGVVSVDGQMFSVSNAYKGELVDVFVDETVIQVWSKNHLIRPWHAPGAAPSERSGPMRSTSNITRIRDVKRQAELDTRSFLTCGFWRAHPNNPPRMGESGANRRRAWARSTHPPLDSFNSAISNLARRSSASRSMRISAMPGFGRSAGR